MPITSVVVFKAGAQPSDERWYLQQVCESIGLIGSSLANARITVSYVDASCLNQHYVVGFATEAGYDLTKCTLTPFSDADGGQGLVLRVMS